jgi:pSer/pThr/pTyr-binding forkhead associated (FHA) protein
MTDAHEMPMLTPAQLEAVTAAEHAGVPFLYWRDGDGEQRLFRLSAARSQVTIGRRVQSDVALSWDPEISRAHAVLEPGGQTWVLVDEGMSRNGSFVNGSRVDGRWPLRDRDRLRFGKTELIFRDPRAVEAEAPLAAPAPAAPPEQPPPVEQLPPLEQPPPVEAEPAAPATGAAHLTESQRKVLVALCRPMVQSDSGTPASNQEIAGEVYLSVHAVSSHMHDLADRFGLAHLPEDEKRARLVAVVLRVGLIRPEDF